ncbi:hypothetical protein BBJ28_00006222 [Nothophytophthora sp. Chile5]|nr:hypothetical protein BBJ28_00006222 [Nothophytophthora sp. Chile5]
MRKHPSLLELPDANDRPLTLAWIPLVGQQRQQQSPEAIKASTKLECLEIFRALKNKDELSSSCKEIMQMITAKDKGVMENEPLNTYGGSRTRGGISHAALQRRYTGKMSGVKLSG